MDNRSPVLLTTGKQAAVQTAQVSNEEDSYGFCTQFMIKGRKLNITKIRDTLESMGKSVIVVGDSSAIRVHIHTLDPDAVTMVASSYGKLDDIQISDMDEQHVEFLILHQEKAGRLDAAIIAVVNGDGMVNAFSDLGVSAVIPGGQTMNPSTIDMLQTVEEVNSDKVILLPNNKNVIPAALLVQTLTAKDLRVIHTETIPQGVSALIAFVPEDDFETNVEQMTEAMTGVRTIEITRATRTTRLNNINVEKGGTIGLLDGELLAAGDTAGDVIFRLLGRIDLAQAGIVTLYYGKDADEVEAGQIGSMICDRYPELEVGVVDGGQPNYDYIISVE